MAPAKKKTAEASISSMQGDVSAASEAPRLTLADLRPAKGSRKKTLRVGRGRATGAGKTCNRGHNGEGQRAGRSRKRGFEGGQMPGYRQMPKIDGFMMVNRKTHLEINVGSLDGMFPADVTDITPDLLQEYGYLKPKHDGVRILGNGDVSRKFKIESCYATPGAKEKIEAAGGQVVSVD